MYSNATATVIDKEQELADITQDLFEQFIYYILPFFTEYLVQLLEDCGKLKWYQYTDDEKERIIKQRGEGKFSSFCRYFENHIRLIKGTIFILKIFDAFGLTSGKFFAVKHDKQILAQQLDTILKKSGIYIFRVNFAAYLFHDLICMALRKFYLSKANKNYAITPTEDIDIEMGNLNLQRLGYERISTFSMQGPSGNILINRRRSI